MRRMRRLSEPNAHQTDIFHTMYVAGFEFFPNASDQGDLEHKAYAKLITKLTRDLPLKILPQ